MGGGGKLLLVCFDGDIQNAGLPFTFVEEERCDWEGHVLLTGEGFLDVEVVNAGGTAHPTENHELEGVQWGGRLYWRGDGGGWCYLLPRTQS